MLSGAHPAQRLRPAQGSGEGGESREVKARLAHLAELDALGPTEVWLEGIAPGKIGHFAGEARVTGVEDFVRINEAKQLTLLASLIHVLRTAASPCARAPTGVRRRSRWETRSTGGSGAQPARYPGSH